MPINGVCRVYEDGALVAEANNLITSYGKSQIPLMLSGQGGYVTDIGVGAATDAGLSYIKVEIAKAGIVFATPSFATPTARVVYKARLDDNVSGVINEISLYNQRSGGATLVGTSVREAVRTGTFTDVTGLSGDPSTGSANVRLGETAANIAIGNNVEVTKEYSITSVLPSDLLTVSGYNATSSANVSTVTLLLTDAYGVTASRTFAFANNSTAYQSITQAISSFTISGGTFNWSRVAKTKFSVSGSASPNVVVDGLTLRSDLAGGTAMTRAVYAAPVVKRYGSRMDVEYELVITL